MYKVNDTVLYDIQRVCRIVEITEKKMGDSRMEYYVLKPVYDDKATMFVPVHNKTATTKMRSVLSADEIRSLVRTEPEEDCDWLYDDNLFRDRYKEILARGDRTELLRLIKALHRYQCRQRKQGRPHVAKEGFLKDAAKMLYEEFSYVLNIEREQMLPFILGQLQQTEGVQ